MEFYTEAWKFIFQKCRNFSKEEIDILLLALQETTASISGELGKQFKTPEEINQAWESVLRIVSSVGTAKERTVAQLKSKWCDLKYRTKKKLAEQRNDFKQTGGGPRSVPPLTDTEEKILSLIGESAVDGIVPVTGDLTAQHVSVNCLFAVLLKSDNAVLRLFHPLLMPLAS